MASCLGGFPMICLDVQMAGANSFLPVSHPPGSFMRLQTFSSTLWPHFPNSQQGSKDRQDRQGEDECFPTGQGDLAHASSSYGPLSCRGWEGSESPGLRGAPRESALHPGNALISPLALCLQLQSKGKRLQCFIILFFLFLFFST